MEGELNMMKLSRKILCKWCKTAAILAAAVLILAASACSGPSPTVTSSPMPSATKTQAPTKAPTPTPTPTPVPTNSPVPTPTPEPVISFPPLETSDAGAYTAPQVVPDKTSAKTNEPIYFRIVTSEKVKSVQTVIDGETGKIYTEYTKDTGVRIWQARIYFTKGGTRKVQFKCAMTSGGTALIPKNPVKISVTFEYTADSTSKTISKEKTVTFTLKTPDNIDSVYAVVDGVKQNIIVKKPDSEKDGIKIWKVNITFFKVGTRVVTFDACDGSKVKETFPDPGITIIVQDSVS